LVYVDDMIVAVHDEHEKQKLATQFKMKDLQKLKYLLGIEIAYSKKDIFISQRKYHFLSSQRNMYDWLKTTKVPIEQNHKLGVKRVALP